MINDAALEIIKRNEGLRLDAYQDVVGVWTIGYGLTGPEAWPGRRITKAEADAFLVKAVEEFEAGVRAAVTDMGTENQIGAMTSLAYNIGLGAFRRSTVLREHRAGNHQAAANAFLMWIRAGGRVLDGLTRRRHEERALYLSRAPRPTYDRYLVAKALQTALLPIEPRLIVDGKWGPASRAAYDKFNRGE